MDVSHTSLHHLESSFRISYRAKTIFLELCTKFGTWQIIIKSSVHYKVNTMGFETHPTRLSALTVLPTMHRSEKLTWRPGP